ncbi:hypothetical protein PI125_g25726 [Phytophthora idaei]|nr:hypothetical protein PI125_g25726 [Phytophthora idaei]KAG3123717.1 hypothetical protein PI126_g23581 [Phytophthora idaei]
MKPLTWLHDLETSTQVTLLFGKNRVTPGAITNAFEKAGSLAVFKFVSARFHVSDNAIIAAFKHAALYGTTAETIKTFSHEISQECIEIVNSLYMKCCIPSQAMSDAFAWAAFKQPIEVATAMYTNHRISPEAIGQAFLNAVSDRRGGGGYIW